MFAILVALIISAACIAASLRRLVFVYDATSFDPEVALTHVRGDEGRALVPGLVRELAKNAPPDEVELWSAVTSKAADADGQLSEQLIELDHRFERWVRVPRVCASIASSSGIMLATWGLRGALITAPAAGDVAFRSALEAGLARSLGVVAIGIVGTVACISIGSEARRAARTRRRAAEDFVDRVAKVHPPPTLPPSL